MRYSCMSVVIVGTPQRPQPVTCGQAHTLEAHSTTRAHIRVNRNSRLMHSWSSNSSLGSLSCFCLLLLASWGEPGDSSEA